MSQIATVELIYVAHSGRQYRAQHKQVHVGWELEDLEQQAKSALSLRDYAIEFHNVNGHKQFIMPTDLETIIVNVVAVTEERWEEPAYEELQQKWNSDLKLQTPDGQEMVADHKLSTEVVIPVKPIPNPTRPVTPDGETTQSIKITWPTAPKPQQRVNWPNPDMESTQPISVIPGSVVGMDEEAATRVIERIAAGGTVTSGDS